MKYRMPVKEGSYPGKDECNSYVRQWFEIVGINNSVILLICEPHGVDDLLDVFVAKEALSFSLGGTHFLVNRLV
jgi:hypothetical protein